jgi:DNA polymerase-3 subunit gamma/tau
MYMGQALYRKYRSKNLGEIVGQEHITEALSEAIKSGRISHAYLFTGPRGTGKTSIARILAHEVNGLPYEHEDSHVDIIEIDAASNRGIDEIRDLREKVYMAPVSAKYKVYIIDEVHMLTTQAFNALLKTLEEPPAHVIFVLATTEAHKLPDTITSRTQRHVFKPVEIQKVTGHLRNLASKEGIKIDEDALELFALQGGGSFRDSISLLDQAGNMGKKVTLETAQSLLGIPPEQALDRLLGALQAQNPSAVLEQLDALETQGFYAAAIAKRLGDRLRADFMSNSLAFPGTGQLDIMEGLLDVAPAHDPRRMLEIVLLRSMQPTLVTQPAAPIKTEVSPGKPAPVPKKKTAAKQPEPAPVSTPSEPAVQVPASSSNAVLDSAVWPDILSALKSKYNTLYGVMRMAVPEFAEGKLVLRFKFAFHQKRMNEAKHRKIVSDTIAQLTGETVSIECIYDKEAELSDAPAIQPQTATAPARPQNDESLKTISNIFGGGELLES